MDKYLQRFVLMLEADTNYKAIRLMHLMRSSISTMVYILLSLTIIVVLTCIRAMADQHTFPTKRDDIGAKQIARVVNVTVPTIQFMNAEAFESKSGGAATSLKHVNRNSFSHPSANLTFAERGDFNLGDGLFRKLWTSSPSSTQASDGLGPLYNARGCQSCHIKDGRGQPPEKGVDSNSMFLRLARNPSTAEEISAIENHRILNFPDPFMAGNFRILQCPVLWPKER